MKSNLTNNEVITLTKVANSQIEGNYSEFTRVESNEEKGVLGSLIKKGLVYDCYEGMGMGYMFCLTEKGFNACNELEIETHHIELY
jgi:hypothetical protein